MAPDLNPDIQTTVLRVPLEPDADVDVAPYFTQDGYTVIPRRWHHEGTDRVITEWEKA